MYLRVWRAKWYVAPIGRWYCPRRYLRPEEIRIISGDDLEPVTEVRGKE